MILERDDDVPNPLSSSESSPQPQVEAAISPELLVESVLALHAQISKLDNLRPSETVNALFSQLVALCLRPCSIDVAKYLSANARAVRADLIQLCGRAEGLLERHYAELLGRSPQPHAQLDLFPYYRNYRKLAVLEFRQLCLAGNGSASTFTRVAFVGSGPMPLTSIVLALHHMPWATFDNYDMDADANELARGLVRAHPDLSARMAFHTRNVKKVKERLADYDVVFLAALVGLGRAAKADILEHLGRHMRAGSALVVRSAHAARAFLYPVVDNEMLQGPGFDVLSVFHPSDEVVNSVIVARKRLPLQSTTNNTLDRGER